MMTLVTDKLGSVQVSTKFEVVGDDPSCFVVLSQQEKGPAVRLNEVFMLKDKENCTTLLHLLPTVWGPAGLIDHHKLVS